MRFGLAGTGYWARTAHAPALAAADDVEFTAVWGRNPQAAAGLAASYQAAAYDDIAGFLAAVDAVSFAVPPDVQAPLATRAAQAGKHLLLEKPIALSQEAADALVDAVGQAGVASVVFFTQRFQPDVRAWLAGLRPGRLDRRRVGLARDRRCASPARSTRPGGGSGAPCGTSARTWSRCCGPASARSRR